MTPIILLGLAIIAYACIRRPDTVTPALRREGWQKLFGLVAIILAVLIIINPEFVALGIVGDSAFFDLLVLTLSLQLQGLGTRAWRCAATVLSGNVRWMMTPSPGMRYLLAVSTLAIASVVSTIHKIAQRISS